MVLVPANLTYRHSTELLAGTIGQTTIQYHAACGGFRGSTSPGKATFGRESFDPQKAKSALPQGKYKLAYLGAPYKHYSGGAVLLWPSNKVSSFLSGHRSTTDFLIHGPGLIGSEGCIVPYHSSHYSAVMSLFKKTYGKVDWTKSESERWHGNLEVVDDPLRGYENHLRRYLDSKKQFTA